MHLDLLELEVFSFNTGAIKVYKKAGFTERKIIKGAIVDGDLIEMEIYKKTR